MSSRWTLDPEIKAVLDVIPPLEFESADIDESAIPGIRATLDADAPPYDGVTSENLVVNRGPGAPELELYVFRGAGARRDAAGRQPGLLWIHGGGYIIGRAANQAATVAPWVNEGYVVVAPEYRLAPEHPFPAGLQDCLDALTETLRRADELGLDPDRLVVGGSSAGAGLAAGLVLLCRDRGIGPISHLVLHAPMVDDSTAAPGDVQLAIWGHAANRMGWQAYLRGIEQSELGAAYAAVARADDVSGFPPTTITVGTADLFCQESIQLAARLLAAGVPVDLHVYGGLPHGFDAMAPDSTPANILKRDIFESLRRMSALRSTTLTPAAG